MTFEYSPQETWYAANLPLEHEVIVDVGANVGRLSEFFWIASAGTARLLSIEPLLDNVMQIRDRIQRHGAGTWAVEVCAVSARTGTVKLRVEKHPGGGWNSVASDTRGTLKVRSRLLSQIAPDASVVKLDIEGHEYVVIQEALPKLPNVKAWAVELHRVPSIPLQMALGAFMTHGYRVYAASPDPAHASRWVSREISATLDWAEVPPSKVYPDGKVFKMLHILALREEARV
jgi:FkbM family methyltransferase